MNFHPIFPKAFQQKAKNNQRNFFHASCFNISFPANFCTCQFTSIILFLNNSNEKCFSLLSLVFPHKRYKRMEKVLACNTKLHEIYNSKRKREEKVNVLVRAAREVVWVEMIFYVHFLFAQHFTIKPTRVHNLY